MIVGPSCFEARTLIIPGVHAMATLESASPHLLRLFCADYARYWARWYTQHVYLHTEEGKFSDWRATPGLARSVHDHLGLLISPEEAGRADRLLCASTETRTLYYLRGWLVTYALVELLESGVAGERPLSVAQALTAQEIEEDEKPVILTVDDWQLTFVYADGRRQGLEKIQLPGETKPMAYEFFDPLDAMLPDARGKLTAMMIRSA